MTDFRILILGGYGQTGLFAAKLLLKETEVSLVIAGRDIEKAKKTAGTLNNQLTRERVTACYADTSVPASLKTAFEHIGLVLVTSSTAADTKNVAIAALNAGADYMDIHFGPSVFSQLHLLEAIIKEKGRCFITGGGFHPGMPAIMIRYSALFFDELKQAQTAGLMKINFGTYKAGASTRREFVEEMAGFNPLYYKKGSWKKMNMLTGKGMIRVDFEQKFGSRNCTPLFFEELRALPQTYPTLTDTGFFIAGFNLFTDYLVFPLILLAQKIMPKWFNGVLSRLMIWSIRTFTLPPFGYILRLDATGIKNKRLKNIQIWISSQDPALITAIPVVACLKQYLKQKIPDPGLYLQAWFAGPQQFMEDCMKMGLNIEIREQWK